MLNANVIHQGYGARTAFARKHRQTGLSKRQRAPRASHGLDVATRAETLVYRGYALIAMVLGGASV